MLSAQQVKLMGTSTRFVLAWAIPNSNESFLTEVPVLVHVNGTQGNVLITNYTPKSKASYPQRASKFDSRAKKRSYTAVQQLCR